MTGSGQGKGPNRSAAKLGGALGALLVAGALGASSANATVTPISSGTVDWGVKESLRRYVAGPVARGSISVSGGVSVNGDGTYRFPVTGGSYDSDTQATVVDLGSAIHLVGHDGELDIEISQPRVEITASGAGIFADVDSRVLGRTATIAYPDVQLGSIDLDGASPVVAGGHVSWSALPSTLTAAAVPAFADFYGAGQALDPLTLDYAGPGGAPLPEGWDRPGQTFLRTLAETELDGAVEGLAVDWSRGTVQVLEHVASPQSFNLLPLDWRTLAAQGGALQLGTRAGRLYPGLVRYADGTVFAGGTDDADDTTLRAIAWDGTAYSASASLADELPATGFFDDYHDRFVGIGDDVLTLSRSGSGWSAGSKPRDFSVPSDLDVTGAGTVLAAGALPNGSSGAAPLTVLDTGSVPVTATAIPGTTLPSGGGYSLVAASLGLSAWAVEGGSPGRVVKLNSLGPLGVSVVADQPAIEVGEAVDRLATDRSDGLVYVGTADGRLAVIRDGRVQKLDQPARAIEVGIEGTLYAAGTVGGREVLRALRDDGVTPSVSQQPEDAVARLATAGDRATVAFTAVGFTSDDEMPPTVRWQSRAAGSLSWTDLGGGNEGWAGNGAKRSTLTVSAGAADAGTRYRVVVSNPKGEIASRAATLSVEIGAPDGRDDVIDPIDPDPQPQPVPSRQLPPAADPGLKTGTPKPAAAKPALSRFAISGTRLSLRVSGPATVRVAISRRAVVKQRVHGKLRTRVRWVASGAVKLRARDAGTVSATLPKLAAGRYRLTAQASSGAGRSAALTRTLVVKKASPRR